MYSFSIWTLKHFDNEASKKTDAEESGKETAAAFGGHDVPVEDLHREEFCKQWVLQDSHYCLQRGLWGKYFERESAEPKVCLIKRVNSPSLCSNREQSYAHPSFLMKFSIKGGWRPSLMDWGVWDFEGLIVVQMVKEKLSSDNVCLLIPVHFNSSFRPDTALWVGWWWDRLFVLGLGKAKSGSDHLLSRNTEHRSQYQWAQMKSTCSKINWKVRVDSAFVKWSPFLCVCVFLFTHLPTYWPNLFFSLVMRWNPFIIH